MCTPFLLSPKRVEQYRRSRSRSYPMPRHQNVLGKGWFITLVPFQGGFVQTRCFKLFFTPSGIVTQYSEIHGTAYHCERAAWMALQERGYL